MAEHGVEIDFLPVGNGDRSGDAIAVRYGTPGNYQVLLYDGGTKDSGQLLVDHVRTYYGTNRVDYVVSSHPDADHASGLSVVLEELQVGELWLHRPWAYSRLILDYFKDGRITDNSLAERLKEKLGAAYALEQLAIKKRIPMFEPFRGASIGPFVVLSPDQNWYVHDLIPEFEKSPEQKEGKALSSLGYTELIAKALAERAKGVVAWIAEKWGVETLREDVTTTAENESSVILFGEIAGKGILLTGDAGIQALHRTADFTEARGVDLASRIHFVQIPHHGSRHNVSTTALDRIVGLRKAIADGTPPRLPLFLPVRSPLLTRARLWSMPSSVAAQR